MPSDCVFCDKPTETAVKNPLPSGPHVPVCVKCHSFAFTKRSNANTVGGKAEKRTFDKSFDPNSSEYSVEKRRAMGEPIMTTKFGHISRDNTNFDDEIWGKIIFFLVTSGPEMDDSQILLVASSFNLVMKEITVTYYLQIPNALKGPDYFYVGMQANLYTLVSTKSLIYRCKNKQVYGDLRRDVVFSLLSPKLLEKNSLLEYEIEYNALFSSIVRNYEIAKDIWENNEIDPPEYGDTFSLSGDMLSRHQFLIEEFRKFVIGVGLTFPFDNRVDYIVTTFNRLMMHPDFVFDTMLSEEQKTFLLLYDRNNYTIENQDETALFKTRLPGKLSEMNIAEVQGIVDGVFSSADGSEFTIHERHINPIIAELYFIICENFDRVGAGDLETEIEIRIQDVYKLILYILFDRPNVVAPQLLPLVMSDMTRYMLSYLVSDPKELSETFGYVSDSFVHGADIWIGEDASKPLLTNKYWLSYHTRQAINEHLTEKPSNPKIEPTIFSNSDTKESILDRIEPIINEIMTEEFKDDDSFTLATEYSLYLKLYELLEKKK